MVAEATFEGANEAHDAVLPKGIMLRGDAEAAHCIMLRSIAALGGIMLMNIAVLTVHRWKLHKSTIMLRSNAAFGGSMMRSDAALRGNMLRSSAAFGWHGPSDIAGSTRSSWHGAHGRGSPQEPPCAIEPRARATNIARVEWAAMGTMMTMMAAVLMMTAMMVIVMIVESTMTMMMVMIDGEDVEEKRNACGTDECCDGGGDDEAVQDVTG